MQDRRLVRWSGLAGALAGVLVAGALVAGGALRLPPHRDATNAGPELLAAWERARTGTFVVQSDWRRTRADGGTLYSATELDQRPPDRLVRQFGGITGRLNGHPLICSTDPTANYRCTAGTEDLPSYEQQVATEVDNLRGYFSGDHPIYRVVKSDPGCFELFLLQPYPDPDYGQYAKLCFDGPTGALRLFERRLSGGVVESFEAVSIRTSVTDADFSTDADPAYDQKMDVAELGDAGTPLDVGPSGTVPPTTGPR